MFDEAISPDNWHKKEAIENFNSTWDLIDKTNRTHEDNIRMIHMAHASRYHWEHIGEPVNLARGEWQISRVYSLLDMAESALLHAEESLRICEENGIEDFDLAFAYEAMARAYSLLNDSYHKELYLNHASNIEISDQENRDYLISELESIR